jgi:hypothetical protein
MTKRYIVYIKTDDENFEEDMLDFLREFKKKDRWNRYKLELVETEW